MRTHVNSHVIKMTSVSRANVVASCIQIMSIPSAHKRLYPWCLNDSHSDDDDNSNESSQLYNAVCDKYTSTLGPTGDYIVAFCLLCITILSIMMNSFVIWSFAVRTKTIISVDYYILTLAISDLSSAVFAYPLTLASTWSHRWIFGETGCIVNGFLGFFLGIVDIFVLTTVSVTRYLCVCHPMAYARLTRAKVFLSLLGVLLMSALWAGLPVVGWGQYEVEPFGTSCTLLWSTPDRSYITSVFAVCLVLPLVVMSTSYSCIIHKTGLASRQLRKHSIVTPKGSRRAKHELRLIRITILMTACFLVAWLPYAIVSMISAYRLLNLEVTGPVSIVPTILAKTSHLSNPVVYFTMNSRLSDGVPCCPFLQTRSVRGGASSGSIPCHDRTRLCHGRSIRLVILRDRGRSRRSKRERPLERRETAVATAAAAAAAAAADAADCTIIYNSVLTLPAPSVDGLLGAGGDVEVGLAGPACQRDSLPLHSVVL